MRTLIGGAVLGVIVGVLGTLGVQHLKQRSESAEANRTVHLFEAVPIVMGRALPGIRVLDVALQTPSAQSVTYEHEALYDAQIKYQLDGRKAGGPSVRFRQGGLDLPQHDGCSNR